MCAPKHGATNIGTTAIFVLATCNLLFVAAGFYVLAHAVHLSTVEPPVWSAEFPRTAQVLFAMFFANGLALLCLAWGSIHLLRFRTCGAVICFLAYALEVLCWFSDSIFIKAVVLIPNDSAMRLAASVLANSALGNSSIAVQMTCLYPFCGMVILAALTIAANPKEDFSGAEEAVGEGEEVRTALRLRCRCNLGSIASARVINCECAPCQ
jgi:hypothetical protein